MLKQLILLILLVPNLLFAQTVKLVVPWGPGGGNDTVGRILAKHLNDVGHPKYIVENRPGAGSSLGTAHVVQSKPDGRTLLVNEITGLVFSTHEQAIHLMIGKQTLCQLRTLAHCCPWSW